MKQQDEGFRMTERGEEGWKTFLTVLDKSQREFGGERLTKKSIAEMLNINPALITNDEWEEISAFTKTSGAYLTARTVAEKTQSAPSVWGHPLIRIGIRNNWYGLIPIHDIFHTAEIALLSRKEQTEEPLPEFIKQDERGRYINPDVVIAELYPGLFTSYGASKPLPVLLSTQEGRDELAGVLHNLFLDDNIYETKEMSDVCAFLSKSNPPTSPEERQKEFENLILVISLHFTRLSLTGGLFGKKKMTSQEEQAIRDAFAKAQENPPAHYKRFAEKVFANETFDTTSRLFLDEFLHCIRTKPI